MPAEVPKMYGSPSPALCPILVPTISAMAVPEPSMTMPPSMSTVRMLTSSSQKRTHLFLPSNHLSREFHFGLQVKLSIHPFTNRCHTRRRGPVPPADNPVQNPQK